MMEALICDKCTSIIEDFGYLECTHSDCYGSDYCDNCVSAVSTNGHRVIYACDDHYKEIKNKATLHHYFQKVFLSLDYNIIHSSSYGQFSVSNDHRYPKCDNAATINMSVTIEESEKESTSCRLRITGLGTQPRNLLVDLYDEENTFNRIRNIIIKSYKNKQIYAKRKYDKQFKEYAAEVEKLQKAVSHVDD